MNDDSTKGANGVDPIEDVWVISTGQVRIHPDHARRSWRPLPWWLFTSTTFTEPLPINVYVIAHRKGLVLFDTGQDRASVTDPRYFPGGIAGLLFKRLATFDIQAEDTLSSGLTRLGYSPGDVHTAIISHLHQDHIGGLRELADARIIVSEAEWRTLQRPAPQFRGLLDRHIDIPGLRWDRVTAEPTDDPNLKPFTNAHDIFGDGSLLLLPTPGHTPGSMSLLVRRPGYKPLIMVGDLTYDVHLLEDGHVPGVGNRRQLNESTTAINELMGRHPGLVVLPAHDPGAAARLAAAVT